MGAVNEENEDVTYDKKGNPLSRFIKNIQLDNFSGKLVSTDFTKCSYSYLYDNKKRIVRVEELQTFFTVGKRPARLRI